MMVSLILSIVLLSMAQIPLQAPNLQSDIKNVKLISENLHYTLTWELDNLQQCTNYEAMIRGKNSYRNWTNMDLICERVNFSCVCDLSKYLNNSENIYDRFTAKVRLIDSSKESNWTASKPLYPFKDSILGPPILNCSLQNLNLTVKISMPFTRYCEGATCLAVQNVLEMIEYNITLFKDGTIIHSDFKKSRGSIIDYIFDERLSPSSHYCVKIGVKNHNRFSQECFKTSPDHTGLLINLITFGVIIVLIVICIMYFAIRYVSFPSKMEIPSTLEIINVEMTPNLCTMNYPDFEADSISIVSTAMYDLEGNSDIKQELTKIELIPENYNNQRDDSYHNNGFGPGYGDNDAYSPSFSSWSSSKMNCIGSVDVNYSASSLEPMKEKYSGNKSHCVASAVQPPTCLYLGWQFPICGNEKPTNTSDTGSSNSHYQKNMIEGLPLDRAKKLLRYQIDIPLNSVKFQAIEGEFKSILEDFCDPSLDNAMEENSPDISSTELLPNGVIDYKNKPQVKEMPSSELDCDEFLKTHDSQLYSFSGYELRDSPFI